MHGITIGDPLYRVQAVPGEPDQTYETTLGTIRIYKYTKLGCWYMLKRAKVGQIGIFDPDNGFVPNMDAINSREAEEKLKKAR